MIINIDKMLKDIDWINRKFKNMVYKYCML
jgi:hypothetical protein